MELTGIAREDLEGKGFICNNKIELNSTEQIEGNCIPDTYGFVIGRRDLKSGILESRWKKDVENGNTEELEKILSGSTTVIEKHRNIVNMKTLNERQVIDYYIPYDIQESSKNKPTATDDYIVGCMNGSWHCEYELLITCGDATRRFVIEHNTVNIGMIDFLSDLEAEVGEAMEDDTDTIFEGIFKKDDEAEECSITMFDEMGIPCDITIESVSDFLNMIVSVRCIKCEFIDDVN